MHLLNNPTEQQLKQIQSELKEDNDRFEHNINLLKNWITFQEHLPKNYDEKILPIFLRGCKHDLEKTKRKIEIYYSARISIPDFYANRKTGINDLEAAASVGCIVPLRNLNFDGYRVTVHKLISGDANLFNMLELTRYNLMIADIRVSEETPIAGDIYILDGANKLGLPHAAKLASTYVGKAISLAHEAYPQRLKSIHIINAPEFAEKLLTVLRGFMKEKMRNRFIIHKKPSDLQQYISPEILPEEYGGQGGNLSEMHNEWQKYLSKKQDWFKEQEQVTAVGPIPKHLAQSCATDYNENLHGSFRKLAID